MKNSLGIMMMVTAIVCTTNISAKVKVVYGKDDRVEVKDFKDSKYFKFKKSMSNAVAAMVSNGKIETINSSQVELSDNTLDDNYRLCSGERFKQQVAAASCTGFLVTSNILVTAGHCVQDSNDCKNNKWVFGYKVKSNGKANVVSKSQVYSCKKILKQRLDNSNQNDYAVIMLNKSVKGIKPLKYNSRRKIKDNTSVVVVGHPSGLPMKIAAGARVRDNDNKIFFTANLDTFGGNSGSPVFNQKTGVVEGILVRGEQDYQYDYAKGCYKVKKCSDNGCRGEDVTRFSSIFIK